MTSIYESMLEFMPRLMSGISLTIIIAVSSIALATILGFMLESLRWNGVKWLSRLNVGLVVGLRGVPTLVYIYYMYFALPALGVDLTPLVAGVTALAVAHSPYMAENMRLAIASVDRGQAEAAVSLGMSKPLVMRRIVFPQAVRSFLPPYGNSMVMAVKDSSLCAVITVAELTRQAQIIAADTFRTMEVFSQAALLYVIICVPMVLIIRYSEHGLSQRGKA
jgi:polar amino acid transport system permease protein